MKDADSKTPEAQGIYSPTAEDIADARKPRDTLWKRLTSSTAARALLVAVSGLGVVTGIAAQLAPGGQTPELGSYDYAVTQVENGTRYTREHVTGIYDAGMFKETVQKNVQVIEVSSDRSDVTFSVALKNESYFMGRKTAEETKGSRFIQPGAVSMTLVGDQTAAFYREVNALNNEIYAVKGAEAALQRIPQIEAKREKYAETVRIVEQEHGGLRSAWQHLVRYNKLTTIAREDGMAAFFMEHAKVLTQKDMDSIIEYGGTSGWRLDTGEVVPMKDAFSVLAEKGSFTAVDGKEFTYSSHADLFRQVKEHYSFAAGTLAPHFHKYDGADDMGGLPAPESPEKVAEAQKAVSDFTLNYGSYELAEVKMGNIFRDTTIRLSETFAQKAQRTPAPQQEIYASFNLTPADHNKFENNGTTVELMLPQSAPKHVTVTATPKYNIK